MAREEAIEMLKKDKEQRGNCFISDAIDMAIKALEQEPKTGHWIRGHHGFGCSNCHKSIEGEWDDNIDDITGTLFCPNCGVRMESEEM